MDKPEISEAFSCLCNISKKAQRSIRFNDYSSLRNRLDDLCTIKLFTSRRGGHDEGIFHFILEKELASIVIFQTEYLRVAAKRRFYTMIIQSANFTHCQPLFDINIISFKSEINKIYTDVRFVRVNEIDKYVRGTNLLSHLDAIIVNDASIIKEENIEEIKNISTNCLSPERYNPFYLMLIH